MSNKQMDSYRFPQVLCPNCTQQGYLVVLVLVGLPEMVCHLCRWSVFGHMEDGVAVFPDPHVEESRP